MIAFGFGEVIGGFIEGWFIDKFNPARGNIFNLLVIVMMTIITIISISRERFDGFSYIMSFSWGFMDGCINIHTYQALGFEFVSQSEPFGVYGLLNGFSCFVFELVQGIINVESKQSLI